MSSIVPAAAGLGFVLGMRHALDPDHVVAVSTIVSKQAGLRRSSLVGAFWGLGHTVTLLAVGVVVMAFKLSISERLAAGMEIAVAALLVLLGANAIRSALRGWRLHAHRHTHDGQSHIHIHVHRPGAGDTHRHRHLLRLGAPPFLVGMVHGLAGSAALMVLVVGALPSAASGLVYVAMFGLGSMGGMVVVSGLLSLPFLFSGMRLTQFSSAAQLLAGLGSICFGVFLAWQQLREAYSATGLTG
jgi:ABC-type nickel/cobalt efflux system permease component RcnA